MFFFNVFLDSSAEIQNLFADLIDLSLLPLKKCTDSIILT